MRLHRLISMIFLGMALAITTGCSGSDLYDDLPSEIASFVTEYFPNPDINSYTKTTDSYYVRIYNGPGLTFDTDYHWTEINGYGMPLPQVLLFDQLPPALYDYIQSAEWLDSVFAISRDSKEYIVVLLKSSLRYDIATATITTIATPASAQ